MPKWAKRKFEGGNDEGARIEACELSQYRKVVVRMWQGKVYVDFREFYTKDGKQLPGKKVTLENIMLIVENSFAVLPQVFHCHWNSGKCCEIIWMRLTRQ
ncbi:uncharacterized protein LOC131068814 isoform X1 [Cryptomeria japonica]|uniref:uncharacterized protein LOC131068814 isoform X1 n=1 Tax=Cryptomeria japonica TaxID=3369 RepID=UPI0025ABD934|nr:uncharacterized protein LOC131068814 isoform X1 [Cryptomeria japonica]